MHTEARPLTAPVSQSEALGATSYLIIAGLEGHSARWQKLSTSLPGPVRLLDVDETSRHDRHLWRRCIDAALRDQPGRVVLLADGMGCHAVAWWAALATPRLLAKVRGALLIAPPPFDAARRWYGYSLPADTPLPFRGIVVTGRSEPQATVDQFRALAWLWGCEFAEHGESRDIDGGLQEGWGNARRLAISLATPGWGERLVREFAAHAEGRRWLRGPLQFLLGA